MSYIDRPGEEKLDREAAGKIQKTVRHREHGQPRQQERQQPADSAAGREGPRFSEGADRRASAEMGGKDRASLFLLADPGYEDPLGHLQYQDRKTVVCPDAGPAAPGVCGICGAP